MKKTPLLLICFLFATLVHAQHPVHQYIIHIYPTSEMSDKPVDEVTIKYGDSTMMQDNDFKVVILTDAATLNNVVAYTRKHIKSHLLSAHADFGSFGVIVNAQTALVTRYYLNSHLESKKYFKDFITLLTARHSDPNVISELQKIYSRIDY